MTQIALITGGQQGIGLGIAEALIDAGFQVAIASRSPIDRPAVQAALCMLGDRAQYFQHDVSDTQSIATLVDSVEARMGPITTLVSNAGVGAPVRGDMLNLTEDNFDFVLDINLRGAFFLAQEVAKRLVKRRGEGAHEGGESHASLVFVTSVSATMVSIERAEYCVSKAGAAMMVQLFAARLAPHGIGVYELRPGIIETGMTAGVKDKYTAQIEGGLVPAKRWGQPADIGQVVVPLVTGQMQFANGAVLPVDGGLSITRL